ncbi:hypothetical protein T10_13640 [Trichinella papuae]|uniref:Uncharacterized protein n=1 Tax=Trichinella papuae TaxID=268474 RepID=A0A0V1MJN4_9BILA|nr:hypothetical protein T10_13640 [Trichinella papuae]
MNILTTLKKKSIVVVEVFVTVKKENMNKYRLRLNVFLGYRFLISDQNANLDATDEMITIINK